MGKGKEMSRFSPLPLGHHGQEYLQNKKYIKISNKAKLYQNKTAS